jgi:hypothetical protein
MIVASGLFTQLNSRRVFEDRNVTATKDPSVSLRYPRLTPGIPAAACSRSRSVGTVPERPHLP